MSNQEKITDILIALLMTSVEDQFVKVEDREPMANPPTCGAADQAIKMLEGEAKNCNYELTTADKVWFLNQVTRIDCFVRR